MVVGAHADRAGAKLGDLHLAGGGEPAADRFAHSDEAAPDLEPDYSGEASGRVLIGR